jgi:hypothetical protein
MLNKKGHCLFSKHSREKIETPLALTFLPDFVTKTKARGNSIGFISGHCLPAGSLPLAFNLNPC